MPTLTDMYSDATIYDPMQQTAGLATQTDSQQTQSKTTNLQNKVQEKLGVLSAKKDTILGMSDADTVRLQSGALRESPSTGQRYDAVELQHGNNPYDMYGTNNKAKGEYDKSKYAMDMQRAQVAKILGKSADQLTPQDMIDVGNQQQVQKLADLVASPGETKWEAPLIRNAEQTNLTGYYKDSTGQSVQIPLDVPVGTAIVGKDENGRDLSSLINLQTGQNVTDIAAIDPRQNAFANQQNGMKAKVQTPEQQDAYKQLMALGTKDQDGRLGETVDLTQASSVKYWGDMAAAARSGSRAMAGTLGLSKESIDKYLPENPKLLGTDLTIEQARKDQEAVDKSVGYSTRDAWAEEKKAYSANITNKEYGSAAWNVATNLDRYLAESAPEMAVLMTPGAGIPSVVATRLNNQMDEFEKTNGRKMTTEEAFATAASIVPSLIAEKLLVKSGVGEALTTGKSIGGKVAGVGKSTAGEGLQEGYEATQEQWATGKAEDRTSLDKLGEYASSNETIGGVIAGGVMGGALRTAGETPEVVAGMLPSAGTAVNVIKKSIELATETDEQKAVRENMKYTAPLKAEAEVGLATGATDNVVSKVEAIHGKLTEDLDESAPKAFTYGRVIRDALTKAAKNEDADAIKNIYKTIAELDTREDVDFKAKDVIDERTYEATKQFKYLINSNETTESKLNAIKLGKQVAAEAAATVKTTGAKMDENILEKVKAMKSSIEQDIKDMKDVMGSDQFDENSKGPKELVDLIDMYISGKGLDTVNAEMSKLGYIELDPSGGLRADPNRPGIQTYAIELERDLLDSKRNKNLLNAKTEFVGTPTLKGLERFANSRLEKLNDGKDGKAYQTDRFLKQLVNENNQMLEVIQKLQKIASGLKGVKADTKTAYETVLDNAYKATTTANEQMARRQEILSKLGKVKGGEYAYQIDKDGNETIQLVTGKDRQEVAKVTAEGTAEWIDDKFANREIKTTAKAVPDESVNKEEYYAEAKFNEDIPIYEEDSPETKAILKELEEAENNGASIEVIEELTDRLLASKFNNKEPVVIEPTMESKPDEVINKEDYKAQAKFTEPVKVTETKPVDSKDPLRAVREKIAKLDETLSAELAKVKDMDVKQHIKDYYAKKLDEISADKTKLNSLFDRIEKAVDARLDRLEGMSTKNPLAGLIAYADKLIKSMLNKLDELRNKLRLNKNQFDATKAELNDLLGMVNTIEQDYLDSKGIKPEVVKTSIGKVTKYADTVYGKPMIETKDKRVEAVQVMQKNGLQSVSGALAAAITSLKNEELAKLKLQTTKAVIDEKTNKPKLDENGEEIRVEDPAGSLGARIMTRVIENFDLNTAVHRIIEQGEDSIFGRMGADMFSNPNKLLEALPKSFKEFFITDGKNGTDSKDLIENFKTMDKFINGVELGPIYMNGEKITGNIDKQGLVQKLTDKYVPVNRPIEAGDKLQNVNDRTTLIIKADKSNIPTNLKDYEVKDIYETSRPVDILELIGTVKEGSTYRKIHSTKIVDDKEVKITELLNPKDKVKDKNGKVWTIQQFKGKEIKLIDPNNDNIKATKSINELESVQDKVLEIDEQTKTILKFYSAKMIIDTQAMVGNILSMDDAELIKYYGLTDAEERQTVRENAANGLVSSASVRKSVGAEVYQALGIKLDRNTPEFTQESFESALGVLVQAIAVDNGTVSMEQEKFKNKYQNLISVNTAMIESDELLGIGGNNALIKAMNKLQYLNENRNRPLPSFKKPTPVKNGERFVMNTKMAVDKETNEKLNKTEEIAYTISDKLDKYLAMPEEDVLKMMGYKDVENSGLHISEQSAQQARNDKLVREWNILKTFAKAAKGKKFYLNWGQMVNSRYTILSDLHYQESKLHREFVVADNKVETVDVNNADNVQMMKASILQGFDMDPDKLSPETASAKFDETFKVTDNGIEVSHKINKDYKGKIILANAGTGKSYVSKQVDSVVDGDDLLIEAVNQLLKENPTHKQIGGVSVLNDVWLSWGKSSKDKKVLEKYEKLRARVYEIQAKLAKESVAKGNTVLIASSRPAILEVVDKIVYQGDTDTLIKSRASKDRENVLLMSTEEVDKKNEKFLKSIEGLEDKVVNLEANKFLGDILLANNPIKKAYESMKAGKLNVSAMAEVFDDSEGHHGLSSIELLVEWDKAIQGSGKFKTASSVEIDAITSGMILTLLQIGTDKAIQMAEKGGIYTADRMPALKEYVKHWLGADTTFTPGALIEAGKKHAAAIEAGANATEEQIDMLKGQSKDLLSDDVFKDLYSTIGVAMIGEVQAYQKSLKTSVEELGAKLIAEMLKGATKNSRISKIEKELEALSKQLAMLDQIGELNLKNIRSIAKSPVMVYIYGASINSIKKKLIYSLGVDTVVKAIKKASELLRENKDATAELEFIDQFIPVKRYKDMYGMTIDTTEMNESDKLLHLEVDEKMIEDIGKVIDATFGTAIETAFESRLGFVDDNRDAVKAAEILTFEAYKVYLREAIEAKLVEKYGSEGPKKGRTALSKNDLVEINNKLIDQGYGHTIVWKEEGRTREQSLDKTADKGGIHSMKVQVGNTKVGGQVKESKATVNTGAAPTISIHAIDGDLMLETLNRELSGKLVGKYTGGNIYDAFVLGLNSDLLKDTADTYNTKMIETGFSRSILVDQLDKLEKMLSGLAVKNKLGEFTKSLGLRPEGEGATDYTKEATRLGLTVNTMLKRLEQAQEANAKRVENSANGYSVGHLYQMGSGVVDVNESTKARAKEFPAISRITSMLKKVVERDRAQTAEEFKGRIADGVDYVLDLNDFIKVKNGTKSRGNLAQFRLEGTKVKLDDNMLETLTDKDTVQILGDREVVTKALEETTHKNSAKWQLKEVLSKLEQSDANVIGLPSKSDGKTKPKSKESPKGKYSTLTKETVPTELNKLVDVIKDENLKSAIGKWVNDKLKTMENC